MNLFGSLSATGKGHGTERAALAGLVGKEPATVDPKFLDSLRDKPDQVFPVKLGNKSIDVSLKDVIYDATKGDFKHPNTMTVKLLAGNEVLLEQEYYSVGGGFIEWKGYTPPKKNPPKYPFRTMKELRTHADDNKTTIAKIMLANEMSIAGRSEEEVNAFIDKIINAMVATVKSGLSMPEDDVLPGPIKLHSKAATVYKRAMDDKYQADRGIGSLSAFALAASEENGRGHLVITAPTGGSAGVMPSLVYGLLEVRKVDRQKIRDGMLAAAAVGYLCKHHATLSAAEGGCQAEIGVASAMAAALTATAYDAPSLVVENAAESALEHHLGMTCDPVAGYVQVPCIERCAFGAVKAWTAFAIASNEIASRHRVNFDETVMALAQTAKDMNSKYKETSEAGLAQSVTLCRLAPSPRPDTGVGVSDERREHHGCDEEYGHAQQDHIDDVTQVVDDDGALTTQGFHRPGQLAAHFRDRLTALGGRPLERGQPLRLEVAQQFAAFRGKRADDRADRPFPLDGNGLHHQGSLPTHFVEDDPSLVQDEGRNAFGG